MLASFSIGSGILSARAHQIARSFLCLAWLRIAPVKLSSEQIFISSVTVAPLSSCRSIALCRSQSPSVSSSALVTGGHEIRSLSACTPCLAVLAMMMPPKVAAMVAPLKCWLHFRCLSCLPMILMTSLVALVNRLFDHRWSARMLAGSVRHRFATESFLPLRKVSGLVKII